VTAAPADTATTIRSATAADAAALARLAEATFRETFGPANTAVNMDLHCARNFGAARQLAEIRNPDMAVLLAEADGRLVAFAQLRAGSAPACVTGRAPREIYRLYVAGAWHGKGLAQQLMAALLGRAFASGADCVWLGVWEHNPRAIAFYEKSGFSRVGEHAFLLGTDRQCDLILERRAGPAQDRGGEPAESAPPRRPVSS